MRLEVWKCLQMESGVAWGGKQRPPPQVTEPLRRRRAGVEPLIQHAKSFGQGRSRMKSDETVLASGYRAVMGFNLHQLMRHLLSAKSECTPLTSPPVNRLIWRQRLASHSP